MKKIIFVVSLVLCFSTSTLVAKQATSKSIKEFMHLTQVDKMVNIVITQMISKLEMRHKDAPKYFWKDLQNEFTNNNSFAKKVIPIYKKYLSEDDIQNMITFYKSKAGKKLIQVQPKIIKDSMIAGSIWGKEVAEKMIKRYKDKYKTKK